MVLRPARSGRIGGRDEEIDEGAMKRKRREQYRRLPTKKARLIANPSESEGEVPKGSLRDNLTNVEVSDYFVPKNNIGLAMTFNPV